MIAMAFLDFLIIVLYKEGQIGSYFLYHYLYWMLRINLLFIIKKLSSIPFSRCSHCTSFCHRWRLNISWSMPTRRSVSSLSHPSLPPHLSASVLWRSSSDRCKSRWQRLEDWETLRLVVIFFNLVPNSPYRPTPYLLSISFLFSDLFTCPRTWTLDEIMLLFLTREAMWITRP